MRTLPGGGRRWFTAGALVALLITTTTACYGTWGIRDSYRNYTTSPATGGGIEAKDGAVWLEVGTGTGKGPFQWEVAHAQLDPTTETGSIQFNGTVDTKAHAFQDGHLMELTVIDPRLELNGDEGTLVADLNWRPYVGFSPATLPPLSAAVDVDFADVDLSGFSWTMANGQWQIFDAPMTGIPAAMTLIGWTDFYGAGPIDLAPLSTSFSAGIFAPSLIELPRISVSRTENLHVGDTIVVSGTGFAPTSGNGTRAPLAGQPSGSYVVFGKFADAWQPSSGGSGRNVIAQRWALPPSSFNLVNGSTNPLYVRIDETGRFTTTLTISGTSTAAGNYGIYSYTAGGAVNATYELAVPLDLNL